MTGGIFSKLKLHENNIYLLSQCGDLFLSPGQESHPNLSFSTKYTVILSFFFFSPDLDAVSYF